MSVDLASPPATAEPRVVFWYRIYCGAMAALYLLCLVAGLGLLAFRDEISAAEAEANVEVMVYGILLFLIGFILVAGFLASFFLPRSRWAWVYHIVMICIGLTSVCTLPASLPLLLYWIKPETQSWYRAEKVASAA